MKKNYYLLLLVAFSLLINACSKKPEEAADKSSNKYSKGVLVVSEGVFNSGFGEVSFFNPDTKIVEDGIFQVNNTYTLGNVLQSIYDFNGKTYLMVNNSKKIEVVQSNSFVFEARINNVIQSRYFMPINDESAYVTSWQDGYNKNGSVIIINLKDNTIKGDIPVGIAPGRMLKYKNKVFVVCEAGNEADSKKGLYVINSDNNNVERIIDINEGANSLQLDANNKLWVLCGGKATYGSAPPYPATLNPSGTLYKINPDDLKIELTLPFISTSSSPEYLNINAAKQNLIYEYETHIFKMGINETTLPNTPIILYRANLYGININPATDEIYCAIAPSFTTNGRFVKYQADGTKIDSFNITGIGPNSFVFR